MEKKYTYQERPSGEMSLLCLEGLPAGAAPGRPPLGGGSRAAGGSQPRVSGRGVPGGVAGWVGGLGGLVVAQQGWQQPVVPGARRRAVSW